MHCFYVRAYKTVWSRKICVSPSKSFIHTLPNKGKVMIDIFVRLGYEHGAYTIRYKSLYMFSTVNM